MAENKLQREKREHETREKTEVKRSWELPGLLPELEPRAGYAQKWVRISTLNETDARNLSSAMREGWVPIKASDQPSVAMVVVENERFKDNLVIGGLIACEMPQEIQDQRVEYFNQQAANQMDAVDNNLMRENDARMPIFNDRKSTVTFGKG